MEADKDTDVSLKAGGDILEVTPKMYSMHLSKFYIHHQQQKDFIDRGRNLAKIVMDKQMLQVSGRGGGEVLDLNPKTVDSFYPSPRKAARASRLQNNLSKLSWNIPANS